MSGSYLTVELSGVPAGMSRIQSQALIGLCRRGDITEKLGIRTEVNVVENGFDIRKIDFGIPDQYQNVCSSYRAADENAPTIALQEVHVGEGCRGIDPSRTVDRHSECALGLVVQEQNHGLREPRITHLGRCYQEHSLFRGLSQHRVSNECGEEERVDELHGSIIPRSVRDCRRIRSRFRSATPAMIVFSRRSPSLGIDYDPWPANLGYRMPAEWETHAATWLSWPHNAETWPGVLPAVETVMVSIVGALAESEVVRINVLDESHERHVAGLLRGRAAPDAITFHRFPTNDAWCRDHGAIFLTRDQRDAPLMALAFEYNAWGEKYPPFDLDRVIPRSMAKALSIPRFVPGMVLEGGSVDVNGAGALLTTERCLFNPNRNPTLDRVAIEDRLKNAFGVEQLIWLDGGIEGDDTDGHIDQLARFVSVNRVVVAKESDITDPNHLPLSENRDRLSEVTLAHGRSLEITDLPMPDPIYHRGRRLPASYANFYVANEIVFLPVFGSGQDGLAREILGDCFAGREIVSIDCRQLLIGLGGVHCLTQQVPLFG